MKKTIAIFAALLAATMLVACGQTARPSVTPDVPVRVTTVTTQADMQTPGLEIDFPELADFDEIDAGLQSCDPTVYNFQMFARRNGLFFYFVQNVVPVEAGTNNWAKTHVELEIWQGDFGYGWDGTYAALFLDGSVYLNHTGSVRTHYFKLFRTDLGEGKQKLEYFYWIEFDNNSLNMDHPYAYVKQRQFMPGVGQTDVPNSVIEQRDDRTVITGDEKSWEVHEQITCKMYT